MALSNLIRSEFSRGGTLRASDKRRKQKNRIDEILLQSRLRREESEIARGDQSRLKREEAELDPDKRAKSIALEGVLSMTRTPQPEGGFSPQERERGIPGQVEGAATARRTRGVLQVLGREPEPTPEDIAAGIREGLRGFGEGGGGGGQGIPGTAGVVGGVDGAAAGPGAFGMTGASINMSTGQVTLSLGQTPAGKGVQAVKTQVEKDLAKRRRETQEGFQRTVGLFTNFVRQFKAKLAAQPGGKGGLVQGAVSVVGAALKMEQFQAQSALPGQRRETALALNNVLTGQNRVIRGVIEMILSTLPDDFDPEGFAAQKMAQSLRNSFMLFKAQNIGVLTEDVLNGFNQSPTTSQQVKDGKMSASSGDGERLQRFLLRNASLTEEEQAAVDALVKQVLSAEAAELETLFAEEAGAGQPSSSGFRVVEIQ